MSVYDKASPSGKRVTVLPLYCSSFSLLAKGRRKTGWGAFFRVVQPKIIKPQYSFVPSGICSEFNSVSGLFRGTVV